MGDRRWAVQTLRELVELESPSGAGEPLAALRDVLVAKYAEAGVTFGVREGGHLDACVGSGERHLLVLGHYDTVWPLGRLADTPFTVAGDVATGPGVFDMKGGLVALLWALRTLDGEPALPLRIVLTADEEIGSPSGAAVVAEACDGAVAALALEPPLANGTLKVGRRGVARVLLSVTGREAHAGLDAADGVSAVDELVDQLIRLRGSVPDRLAGAVNVGRVAGGSRANVVAGQASAELGLRFTSAEDEALLGAALAALTPIRADARLELETLSHRPAWEPDGSRVLADHVVAVAARLGEDVTTAVSGGAGDANLTGARGIPTVDGLGPRGRGAHAPDETVEVPSILARARLLRELFATPLP